MKFKNDIKERMLKTFIQSLLGYIAVNIWLIDFNNEREVILNSCLALIIAGVSSALCVMMNLETNNEINIEEEENDNDV